MSEFENGKRILFIEVYLFFKLNLLHYYFSSIKKVVNMNDVGTFIAIIAMIIFHFKLFAFYRLKKPNKSIFLAYIKGEMILYIFLSFFPLKVSNYIGFEERAKKINILTYLFYTLLVVAFGLGLCGYHQNK